MTAVGISGSVPDSYTKGMSDLLTEVISDATSAAVANELHRVFLPPANAAFPGLPDTLARRAERARLYAIVQSAMKGASRDATSALADLDPRTARNSDLMTKSSRGATGDLLRTFGLNRYIWAVAAGGGGSGTSGPVLKDYFTAAGRWVALQQVANMLLEQDREVSQSVFMNPHFEVIRRISATEIRFLWVSRIILESAVDAVTSDPHKFGKLTWLTRLVVDEYFAYVLSAVGHTGKGKWTPAVSPSAGLQRLLSGMSLPAGRLAGRSFHDLMLDNTIETKPLVQYADLIFPAAPREATLTVERAFFELVRAIQGDPPRADLYEEVLIRVLHQVAPPSLVPLGAPINIRRVPGDPNPKDPGQTDYALTSMPLPTFAIIGEAKSHFVSAQTDSVIQAFSSDMGKAVRQLDLRLRRLAAGSVLSQGSVTVRLPSSARLRGIATPLHSYATAVLDRDALAEVDGDRNDIATIPLHQLILVMQTMCDPADLRRYLTIRANAIQMRMIIWDEVDLLVNHLQDWNPLTVRTSFDLTSYKVRPALVGRSIDPHLAVSLPQPSDRESWRRRLLAACHFVAPPRS